MHPPSPTDPRSSGHCPPPAAAPAVVTVFTPAHAADLDDATSAVERAGARFLAGDRTGLLDALRAGEARLAVSRASSDAAVQRAARSLADALARWSPRAAQWSIRDDGQWFEAPTGARMLLEHRPILAAMLGALARAHRDAPGAMVSSASLAAVAWPDEHLAARGAAERAHTAVSTLRRLGLDAWIRRVDDGYCLDPDAPLHIVSATR